MSTRGHHFGDEIIRTLAITVISKVLFMLVLSHFTCVQLFVTLWTVARQAPLQARILEKTAISSSRGSS